MNIIAWIAIALIGLGAFFAQSSSTEPAPATPNTSMDGSSGWSELLADARANATSDLELRILEDGVITPEEYKESVQAYLTCMNDAGYVIETIEEPLLPGVYGYAYTSEIEPVSSPVLDPSTDPFMQADLECSIGTTLNIESLYIAQITNPNDEDIMELTLACLIETGVIEEGHISAEKLEMILATGSPLPEVTESGQGVSCLVNPAQNGINGNPLRLPEPDMDIPAAVFPSRTELIEDTRAHPASDLEQRILEDGIVTPEEYEEAVTAFLGCMETHGYETWSELDRYIPGVYYYVTEYDTDSSTPAVMPEGTPTWNVVSSDGATGVSAEDYRYYNALDTCSTGTTQMIEAIYVMQVVNPDDVDILELTIACLVANDIIEPGEVTAKQFDAEMRTESPDLPFNLAAEQVASCLANPAQNGVNGNPLVLPATEATPGA